MRNQQFMIFEILNYVNFSKLGLGTLAVVLNFSLLLYFIKLEK